VGGGFYGRLMMVLGTLAVLGFGEPKCISLSAFLQYYVRKLQDLKWFIPTACCTYLNPHSSSHTL